MKYLGTNLTKAVFNLNSENSKTLLREIEEELNKWRETRYSWLENVSSPQTDEQIQCNNKQNPNSLLFTENGKLILKIMEMQKTQNGQKEEKNCRTNTT